MGSKNSRWLFKEEPSHYSFDRLQEEGRTVWSGVRNNLALKNLRTVARGDQILFYHSGDERQVVGVMRATSDPYMDPDGKDEKLTVIDVEPVRKLKRPVSLSEMKGNPRFRGFDLLRISRLSVMPVPEMVWEEVMRLGGSSSSSGPPPRGSRASS
jgi:predicted RNA-binding protein with PUA-like domain